MFGAVLLVILFVGGLVWLIAALASTAARREEDRKELAELRTKVSRLERMMTAVARRLRDEDKPEEAPAPESVVAPAPSPEKVVDLPPPEPADPVSPPIPNVVSPVLGTPEGQATGPTYIDYIHHLSVASDPVAAATRDRERETKPHAIELRAEALETFVGQRVLGWAAVALGILAVGFFLKYAYDQGWILPIWRVLIGEAIGVGLIVLGLKSHRESYYLAGQMLNGCGLVACYLATYAAFGFYDLISQPFATVLMSVVMLAAGVLAVRTDAFALGVMAVLGGLLTPILLRSEADQHVSLFSYLALLVASIHVLHVWKPWPVLRSLVWAGAYGLFWLWFAIHYGPAARGASLIYLAILSAIPLMHIVLWRRQTAPEVEDWLLFLIPPCLGFATAVRLLEPDLHVVLGKTAFVLSALFGLLAGGLYVLGRHHHQRVQMAMTLAVVFLTVSIPYELAVGWIGVGWLAVGLGLWLAGLRGGEWLLRAFAVVLLIMGTVRILTNDLAFMHEKDFVPFLNAQVLPGLLLSLGLAVAAYLAIRYRKRMFADERPVRYMLGWVAMACFWGVLSLELFPLAARWGISPRWLALPWGLYGLALLHFGIRTRCVEWRAPGWMVLVAAVGRSVLGDLPVMRPGPFVPLLNQLALPVVLMAALMMGVFLWAGRYVHRLKREEVMLRLLAGLASFALFLLILSWDVHNYLPSLHLSERWLAVVWTGYALMLWVIGLAFDRAEWRVFGLLLFAGAAVRSLLGDLPLARSTDFVPLLNQLSLPVVLTGLGVLLYRRLAVRFASRIARDEQEVSLRYAIGGVVLLFLIVSLDGYAFFKQLGVTNRWIAVVWVVLGHGVWVVGLLSGQMPWRTLGTLFVAMARLRSVVGDIPLHRTELFVPLFNQLSLPIVLTAASLFVVRSLIKRTGMRLTPNEQRLGILSGLVAIGLLFGIISVDTFQFGMVLMGPDGRLMAHAALSVVWAVFAGVLLAFGFWRQVPVWRWVALGIFGMTLVKVFLIDLGWLAGLYRILAFLCISLVLGAATWAYQRKFVR
jgi:uncharacterized membrane protein